RRPALRLFAGTLAAAAAILAVARLVPRAEGWRALEVTGGEIALDGEAVRATDLARLGPAIMGADALETGASHVRLALADRYRLDAGPGTRLRPREFARAVAADEPARLAVEAGEILLWRNPARGGGPLTVATPAVQIAVTGTVLGVLCLADGTCVSVAEGGVTVDCCGGCVQAGESHVHRAGLPCAHHALAAAPDRAHAERLTRFLAELARTVPDFAAESSPGAR
ncbi:MAG: FecR family protein, partial [Planctomycetota bacterium]